MKARIKGTNILIDVERTINPCSQMIDDGMYIDKTGRTYQKDQLDIINTIVVEPDIINWQKVFIKASIEAMNGLCSKYSWKEEDISKNAVKQALSLVEEMKAHIHEVLY